MSLRHCIKDAPCRLGSALGTDSKRLLEQRPRKPPLNDREPISSGSDLLAPGVTPRFTGVKLMILFALTAWAFWPELRSAARVCLRESDWSHGLIAPLAIGILVYRRRCDLRTSLTRGSALGVIGLMMGIGLFAVTSWPFDYAYLRSISVIPVVAGVILAMCGWRVLRLSLPMLLLLLLSIPVGARAFSSLTTRMEGYTLSATRFLLNQLPGVTTVLDGPTLIFISDDFKGTIALGETRCAASLLVTYVFVGVFVVFIRIRPSWQVAALALAAIPISLLCNLVRLVCQGILTVYISHDAVNPSIRTTSAVISLTIAYLCFALTCWLLSWIFEGSDDGLADDTSESLQIATE